MRTDEFRSKLFEAVAKAVKSPLSVEIISEAIEDLSIKGHINHEEVIDSIYSAICEWDK